jgi:hypothetical protein
LGHYASGAAGNEAATPTFRVRCESERLHSWNQSVIDVIVITRPDVGVHFGRNMQRLEYTRLEGTFSESSFGQAIARSWPQASRKEGFWRPELLLEIYRRSRSRQ